MTIESPESFPEDEPQEASAGTGGKNDGGIPGGQNGVGVGAGAEPNTFEPEEDPAATDAPETD